MADSQQSSAHAAHFTSAVYRTSRPRNPAPPSVGESPGEVDDLGGGVPGLLFVTVAEDAGGALHKGFLPSLYLAGVDLVTSGQLGPRFLALRRLQGHPSLESKAMLSPSYGHFPLILFSWVHLSY